MLARGRGKRKRQAEPRTVGSWVSQWIRSTRSSESARIYQAWEERVEPRLRGGARLSKWESGTLWVEVDSSAALEEISTYGRESILSELAPEGVREIRFVLARRR